MFRLNPDTMTITCSITDTMTAVLPLPAATIHFTQDRIKATFKHGIFKHSVTLTPGESVALLRNLLTLSSNDEVIDEKIFIRDGWFHSEKSLVTVINFTVHFRDDDKIYFVFNHDHTYTLKPLWDLFDQLIANYRNQ